jgi:hypothetical protein
MRKRRSIGIVDAEVVGTADRTRSPLALRGSSDSRLGGAVRSISDRLDLVGGVADWNGNPERSLPRVCGWLVPRSAVPGSPGARTVRPMTDTARDRLNGFLHDGDQTIWSTAALVVASQGGVSDEQRAAARAVVEARGLDGVASLSAQEAAGLAAQAAAPVHQVAALLQGHGQMWATQSDDALIAQGRASAQGAGAFAKLGVPMLAGLQEAFDDGARMLDVGTGVAAMAVAYAELFPRLTVVGIDVLPRVLALARQTVKESAVGDRVTLREQDISSLDEPETYALVWLPAPFIPEPALRAGVVRAVDALCPGGWMMVGHGKYGGTDIDDAVGRFKTIAYGGTALDDGQAQDLLGSAGLVEVKTVTTPHGAPAITIGRKTSRRDAA